MTETYHHLLIEQRGDVFCVRLRSHRIEETDIHNMTDELVALGRSERCRGLAVSLGPESPECLYSVFLAKLYWAQRVLRENGVGLVLCDVHPAVRTIFEAVKLDDRFRFAADFDAAVAELTA